MAAMPRDIKKEKMYRLSLPDFVTARSLKENFENSSPKQHAENPHRISETKENSCGTVKSKIPIFDPYEITCVENAVPMIIPSVAPRYIKIPHGTIAGKTKNADANITRRHSISNEAMSENTEITDGKSSHRTSYET